MPKDKSSGRWTVMLTKPLASGTMTSGVLQVDEEALRQAEQAVALEWRPGEVILDLYEVRTVTEGFGDDAVEKDFHLGGFGRVYRVWHRGWLRDMAVKTPRLGVFATERQKEVFIHECETWVNLGLHPHIAACHYVRELGRVPRVFSEYADAGTLSQWIHAERLYDGGAEAALARILDVAIQFAWGLHYAHECGVIHQDVKPLNALMWHDGTLKVTDFGLAGARQHSNEPPSGGASEGNGTIFVSRGGMTPAYCSPEQDAGKRLSRKTDLWSWAVSLLEMFQGEATWQSGALAGGALEIFLKHNGEDERIPAMPAAVAAFLRCCFEKEPEKRPDTMSDCAKALIEIYGSETGTAYPRKEPFAATDTPDALNNRALSFLDLGKAREAERLFEQALQKDYHNLAATYNGGLLKWRMGYIDDIEVCAALEAVRNDNPSDWRVLWALGQVDMERGDFPSARKHLEQALTLGGDAEVVASLNEAEKQAAPASEYQRTFESHSGPVNAVCMSADEKYILSAAGYAALLQEIPSGRKLHVLSGHSLTVTSLAFSPDGRHAVSGSADDTIKVWEIAAGKCLRTLTGHAESVYSVAYSPDGRFILSGSEDRTVKLWEAVSGRCLRTFTGHQAAVRSVCFSPHGLFALSASGDYGEQSADNSIRLWEVASGIVLRDFTGHEGYVSSACFSPDSQYVLSGGSDMTVRLWEIASGDCLRIFEGHEGGVRSVAFSPNGLCAVSGDDEKIIRQWEIATGRCLRTFEGHKAHVSSVCFSHNGNYVLSGSWDQTLKLWMVGESLVAPNLYTVAVDVDIALERQHTHEEAIGNARASLEAGNIALAIKLIAQARAVPGFERAPEALDICRKIGRQAHIRGYRGAWLNRIFAEHAGGVLCVAVSPDGNQAVSGSRDRFIRIWDVVSGECVNVLDGHTREVNCLAFSPDGRHIISGGSDHAIRLWNADRGSVARTFEGQKTPVYSVAFSPDGLHVMSGDEEGMIKVWDAAAARVKRSWEAHKNKVTSVCFSPDGRLALSGSWDHTVKLWDTRRGRCYHELNEHGGMVDAVCFSPDGRLALSGSWDKKIMLWETDTGRCLRVFEGHTGSINSIAFSPDGRYIVSGAGTFVGLKRDDTIRLWELDTGRCLRIFEGHADAVLSLCFSPDGRFVLSGSDDATLLLWEIDWEYEF